MQWRPEIQHHCDAPFVLVGLKADLARDMGDSSSCSSSPLSDRGEEEQQAEGEVCVSMLSFPWLFL